MSDGAGLVVQIWEVVIVLDVYDVFAACCAVLKVGSGDLLADGVYLPRSNWDCGIRSRTFLALASGCSRLLLLSQLLRPLELLEVFVALTEINEQVFRDLVLVFDEEDGVQLLVGPEEILVQLQQVQVVETTHERESTFLAAAIGDQLSELTLDLERHTEVDNEVKLAELGCIETGHDKIHLVQLIPREEVILLELSFVELALDEVREVTKYH